MISSTSFHFTSVSRGLIKTPQHYRLTSHGLNLLFYLTLLIHLYLVAGQGWGPRTHVIQLDKFNSSLHPAQGLWKGQGVSTSHGSHLHFTKDLFHKNGLLRSVSYSPPAPFGCAIWGQPGSGPECLRLFPPSLPFVIPGTESLQSSPHGGGEGKVRNETQGSHT